VLLVEDSDIVRAPIRRMLVALGYRVTEASGGREALQAYRTCPQPVDLLLTDVIMRDLPGPELAARLAGEHPGLRVLFMSGYTENAIVHHGVLDPQVNFISKPFTLDRLRQAVARALG